MLPGYYQVLLNNKVVKAIPYFDEATHKQAVDEIVSLVASNPYYKIMSFTLRDCEEIFYSSKKRARRTAIEKYGVEKPDIVDLGPADLPTKRVWLLRRCDDD